MRAASSLILASLLVATTVGTAIAQEPTEREQTLVYGVPLASAGRWDPHVGAEGLDRIVTKAAYDTLVTYVGNDLSQLVPGVATEWSVSDDALTYTFTLNPEARFNSGNPLTSADVKWTYERLFNLAGPPSFLAEPIASIEAPDPQTVVINLKSPDVTFLRRLPTSNFAILDSVAAAAAGGVNGPDAPTTDTLSAVLETSSMGSGPYQISEWVVGERLVFDLNPNSWRPEPYFKRLILVNVEGMEAQVAGLKQGDLDITQELRPGLIEELKADPEVQIVGSPGLIWYLMGMTRRADLDPAVSQQLVQEAIHLALDYEGIAALAPDLQPWYGMNPPYLPGGVQEDERPVRDLERARALLAEAGFADGFETEICTSSATSTQPSMLDYAQKIQADLAEVGITTTIDAQENTAFLTKYRAGAEEGGEGCKIVLTIDGPAFADPSQIADFLPGGPRGNRLGWNADNLGWDGEAYVALRDQAMAETDEATRVDLWHQIGVGMNTDGPWIGIGSTPYQFAASADIQGFDVGSNDVFLFDPYVLSR